MWCSSPIIPTPATGIERLKRSVPTSCRPCSRCCFVVAWHGSEEKEDSSECRGQVALEIPRRAHPSQFRRRATIRQGSQVAFEKSATHLGTGFGLHLAQTPTTPFSHFARDRGRVGRSTGRRFGGSATLGQVQPRGAVPDDRGGCSVQVRVGPTLESRQHLSIPRRTASTRGRVQCHPSSGHWHGSPRRDLEQRGSRVEAPVRQMVETETHPPEISRGGSGASRQSAPYLRERLFARVDRGIVCGASRDPRSHSHLQDSRVGWIPRGRYLLQRRFAKSAVGGRRLVSHRKGT